MADKSDDAKKSKADAKADAEDEGKAKKPEGTAPSQGGYNQKKFRKGKRDDKDDPFKRSRGGGQNREELKSAEEKFESLIHRRDDINRQARQARDDRDMLQDKRKELMATRRGLEDQRDELTVKMREHKKRRNEYQARAKALIAMKKDARKTMDGGLGHDIKSIESELRVAKMKQETLPMSIQKENELVDEIREKTKELERLKKVIEEQKSISSDVEHLDADIDELFKLADEEHKKVVEFGDQAHALHERVVELIKEVSNLIINANKKHEEFIALRVQADEYHKKALEMEDKILSIKNEDRKERREARAEIEEQNKKARDLTSKDKLDQAADKALEELLKKGKIGFMG